MIGSVRCLNGFALINAPVPRMSHKYELISSCQRNRHTDINDVKLGRLVAVAVVVVGRSAKMTIIIIERIFSKMLRTESRLYHVHLATYSIGSNIESNR